MQQITELSQILGGMPVVALGALVILAAFWLAGHAISAMAKLKKGPKDGD